MAPPTPGSRSSADPDANVSLNLDEAPVVTPVDEIDHRVSMPWKVAIVVLTVAGVLIAMIASFLLGGTRKQHHW